MKKLEAECCDVTCVHYDAVEKAKVHMPAENLLKDLAEFYKVFADTTRVRILYVLLESEMCVCDLSVLLNMTQSAISHQLRVLKAARIVKNRKAGRVVYYSLDDDHIGKIFAMAFDHVTEEEEG